MLRRSTPLPHHPPLAPPSSSVPPSSSSSSSSNPVAAAVAAVPPTTPSSLQSQHHDRPPSSARQPRLTKHARPQTVRAWLTRIRQFLTRSYLDIIANITHKLPIINSTSTTNSNNNNNKNNNNNNIIIFLSSWTILLIFLSFIQPIAPTVTDTSTSSSSTTSTTTTTTNIENYYLKDNQTFLSKYAHQYSDAQILGDYRVRLTNLSIEIFTSPKPFNDRDYTSQVAAIKSWKRLQSRHRHRHIQKKRNIPITITLLGDDTGYAKIARKFRLNHDKAIDTSFQGVPLFNSLIARANASTSSIAVFINSDIHLYDDFITCIEKAVELFNHFLLIGARYDVEKQPPKRISSMHRFFKKRKNTAVLHTYGGMDVWAWNTNGASFLSDDIPFMPPFIFGRGRYDNWFTHETIRAGKRSVIDISETAFLIHVKHDYHLVTNGDRLERSVQDDYWSEGKNAKFELFINVYLSLTYGKYMYQKGGIIHAPWKLSKCYELSQANLCVLKRVRPGVCNCESSPFTRDTQTDPVVTRGTTVIRCGRVIVEHLSNYTLPCTSEEGIELMKSVEEGTEQGAGRSNGEDTGSNEITQPLFGLPLTMEPLVNKMKVNNTIILTGINYAYKDMLMNWVCNLRRLNINNYVVAAMDKQMYQYAFLHSLPVYYFQSFENDTDHQVTYGTDEFRRLTKLKTRIVIRILKLGVDVLWSDVDITFFKNPLLSIYGHPNFPSAHILIQSNAPDGVPLNRRRRLNSGFYFAKASAKVITTFAHIIKYAVAAVDLSEQPCFYDVVCGQHAQFARANDQCVYSGVVVVQILDTDVFANGRTQGMWNYAGANGVADHWPDTVMLHNNWIVGLQAKWDRLARHGFVFWSSRNHVCSYDASQPVALTELQRRIQLDEDDADLNH